jgi:hypothetical protein
MYSSVSEFFCVFKGFLSFQSFSECFGVFRVFQSCSASCRRSHANNEETTKETQRQQQETTTQNTTAEHQHKQISATNESMPRTSVEGLQTANSGGKQPPREPPRFFFNTISSRRPTYSITVTPSHLIRRAGRFPGPPRRAGGPHRAWRRAHLTRTDTPRSSA